MRMAFSFHHPTALLQPGSGGWNCSVPYWEAFLRHFPCNLHPDCADSRDEAHCVYTTDRCPLGQFGHRDNCYEFVRETQGLTWNDAFRKCKLKGGHLLSLNDPGEWQYVFDILSTYQSQATIYLGLRTCPVTFPPVYSQALQHADNSIAYYMHSLDTGFMGMVSKPGCLSSNVYDRLAPRALNSNCHLDTVSKFVCEMEAMGNHEHGNHSESLTVFPPPLFRMPNDNDSSRFVACPQGHMTYHFLACDVQCACWAQHSSSCSAPMAPLPPSFVCANRLQSVPYSLVCDFRADCSDRSDENFCWHRPCQLETQFECYNRQCIPLEFLCNKVNDCLDGSDEEQCSDSNYLLQKLNFTGPNTIQFKGYEIIQVPLNQSVDQPITCPASHFYCSGSIYCLPMFLRCNGQNDCPRGQDEAACNTYTCADLYRCRGSTVCLRPQDICDGFYHCPQYDDELFCPSECPQDCICYDKAFFCSRPFPVIQYKEVRFLYAKGSGLRPEDVEGNIMLIHLNLADCGLKEFLQMRLPNLHSLDLSDNQLSTISQHHISRLTHLSHLSLASNPLTAMFADSPSSSASSFPLLSLDLSHVPLMVLDVRVLRIFPSLQALNLTQCGVDELSDGGFKELIHLQTLDLRGCPVTHFSADLFAGLDHLDAVFSDNYKLCCPVILPSKFNLANCKAPSDEISSCDNLLRSDIYRSVLSCLAGLALLGNFLAFVWRVILEKVSKGFDVFTVTLCVSDFFMGIYLVIIGAADQHYMGTYVWRDVSWRSSAFCKAAGFVSLLSSEVSALLICLITIDRFLIIHFPFSQVHFRKKSALVASGLVWVVGVALATIPLLPATSHWEFYSQNSICIPLPITRNDFHGHDYSFGLFVVFNFALFFVIAVGQLFIYWSVQHNSMQSQSSQAKTDLRLARRLFTVAFSDFLCWFPIGLLGILASTGVSISSEVNVAIAVFVLPLNSAINPFLYTLNKLLEKRRQEKENRLKQFLIAKMKRQGHREIEVRRSEPR